ncbi:MAG: ABC transporter substrate-binding protein, partial [Atribacterota bacterium]
MISIKKSFVIFLMTLIFSLVLVWFVGEMSIPGQAAEEVNAYSIWPENWARPMFEEFEKATGIHVNFIRFSSGEALARVIAEKSNPQVDVLFGGPVETHSAGISEGVFEAYKPPVYDELENRFKDADGYWVGIADDP